jgi:3',5'-cyclic AMP phosphodiesterase CpdA
MKIAHISDLHLLALEGAIPWRLFNKRFSGYVNLRFRRKAVHKPHVLDATLKHLAERSDIDHIVVTGDVSNLALEGEFEGVRERLRSVLKRPATDVTLVPGNHDAYTMGAYRSQRFESFFADYMTNDLDNATGVTDVDRYPFVRLRGPLAIVGLSTARPRPPIVASGEVGPTQRHALRALLQHDEVRSRTVVLLQHHPWHPQPTKRKQLFQGLLDANEERSALDATGAGLLLHGHLHRRIRRSLSTDGGHWDCIGATSASLLDDDPDRMAGYNLYDFSDAGELQQATAMRFLPHNGNFEHVTIPTEGAPEQSGPA